MRWLAFASGLALAACGTSSTATDGGTPDARDVAPAVDVPVDRSVTDAGADTAVDAGADAGVCVNELPGTYTFYYDGGRVAYTDHVTLTPPRSFQLQRTRSAGTLTCTADIADCSAALPSGTVGVGVLVRFLTDPDVTAALAMHSAAYGYDSRPADGQVFILQHGSDMVQVGDPCRVTTGPCNAIPPGIEQLLAVLQVLHDQEVLVPACAVLRPDGG